MNKDNDFILMISIYVITLIIIIVNKNLVIIDVLAISILFLYHFFSTKELKTKLVFDKQKSVNKLKYKLNRYLRESKETYGKFISLTESINSGILLIDDEGIIQYANREFKLVFDCLDIENIDFHEMIHDTLLHKFINEAYLLETNLNRQIKYKDNYFDLNSTPLFDDEIFIGFIVVAHDITLLKDTENLQKRFTADVSHELKTPLSAIMGISELLLRDTFMKEKDRLEFLEIIEKESKRMDMIVRELLTISRMDRHGYELEYSTVDTQELFNDTVLPLKMEFEKKNIELKSDVEHITFSADIGKLKQVLINLMKNALMYTDQGSVTVRIKKDDHQVIITVSDTGIGIKEKDLDNIFDRFYRVDKARSRDKGGTGLGLSLCKLIVTKHRGSIKVNSVVHEGSTFEIRLPLNHNAL